MSCSHGRAAVAGRLAMNPSSHERGELVGSETGLVKRYRFAAEIGGGHNRLGLIQNLVEVGIGHVLSGRAGHGFGRVLRRRDGRARSLDDVLVPECAPTSERLVEVRLEAEFHCHTPTVPTEGLPLRYRIACGDATPPARACQRPRAPLGRPVAKKARHTRVAVLSHASNIFPGFSTMLGSSARLMDLIALMCASETTRRM